MRAFRRIARIVHPDKNTHLLAKEAFQKLLSSSLQSCLKGSKNSDKNMKNYCGVSSGLFFDAEEFEFLRNILIHV